MAIVEKKIVDLFLVPNFLPLVIVLTFDTEKFEEFCLKIYYHKLYWIIRTFSFTI